MSKNTTQNAQKNMTKNMKGSHTYTRILEDDHKNEEARFEEMLTENVPKLKESSNVSRRKWNNLFIYLNYQRIKLNKDIFRHRRKSIS